MSSSSSKPCWSADNFDFGWINSSFESEKEVFDDSSQPSVKATKRKRQTQTRTTSKQKLSPIVKQNDADLSWNEIFRPNKKEDLAVHPKKVAEVEDWLKSCLKKCQKSSILLLTGPAGSGKTATIRALSKEMSFEICEWSSSVFEGSSNAFHSDVGAKYRDDALADVLRQSQTSVFRNFLLRANKYTSLFAEHCDRIILVEEFPNVFLRDPSAFHETLRRYYKMAKCPIVFIMSESKIGNSLETQLFPKNLQLELKIHQITFNPVAPTMLIKALKRIAASKEKCDSEALDKISMDSMGDIRNAVNTFQFIGTSNSVISSSSSTSKAKPRKNHTARKKKTGDGKRETSSGVMNQRNSSLFLFHALGKILYCKREEPSGGCKNNKLPSHLSHFDRVPLVENPEEVYGRASISSEGFTLFLHENYLMFTKDLESAANSAASFSEADVVSIDWAGRETLNEYSASMASRGLMFNLNLHGSRSRWETLHKPQYYGINKENRNMTASLKNAFRGTRLTLEELETELVPYLAKLKVSSSNREQSDIINRIGRMSVKGFSRNQAESLCTRDAVCDDSESQENLSSQPSLQSVISAEILVLDSDEEIEIEDPDS